MRAARWLPFVLYLEGTITTYRGLHTPWIDFGGGDFDRDLISWRNGHVVSNVGHGAWLLATFCAIGLIGVGIYWLILGLQNRLSSPPTEVAATAKASVILASIGFVCIAYMTVLTYAYARDWVLPSILERPETPIQHATVTFAPWLALGGLATFIIAGVCLSRVVRDWRAARHV